MGDDPCRLQPTRIVRRHRANGTRAWIVAAAEVVARDGVATGTMAAILRASGQCNEAATGHHVGAREGLAVAIIEARRVPCSEHRMELLERAMAGGRIPSIRGALETIIHPFDRGAGEPRGSHPATDRAYPLRVGTAHCAQRTHRRWRAPHCSAGSSSRP